MTSELHETYVDTAVHPPRGVQRWELAGIWGVAMVVATGYGMAKIFAYGRAHEDADLSDWWHIVIAVVLASALVAGAIGGVLRWKPGRSSSGHFLAALVVGAICIGLPNLVVFQAQAAYDPSCDGYTGTEPRPKGYEEQPAPCDISFGMGSFMATGVMMVPFSLGAGLAVGLSHLRRRKAGGG